MYVAGKISFRLVLLGWVIFGVLALLSQASISQAASQGQIPTVSIPTVTGTPWRAVVTVLDNEQGFINVRAGPNAAAYEIIGVLASGAQVPGVGRSPGGDWIQVAYPGAPNGVGWVWSELVLVRGTLPIVEPPPTPTPRLTVTVDPTLAAQFLVEIPPTRLPTFTEPPPLPTWTKPEEGELVNPTRIPMGLVISALAVTGLIGLTISLLGGR